LDASQHRKLKTAVRSGSKTAVKINEVNINAAASGKANTPLSPPGPSGSMPDGSPSFARHVGGFRWVICALLLFGVTKNYMDRQVLGVLKTTLQHDLHWNEIDYSNLVFAFQAAYAVGLLIVGRFIDRLGTRAGYALAMVFWSLASMAHAVAGSFLSFVVVRSALGFGESGVFPASIKCVAEWFPKKERALATGIFNAGSNAGAILTPLVVPWITLHWGWRAAFIVTGSLGFLWLIFWMLLYRPPERHSSLSRSELQYITGDARESAAPTKIKWMELIPHRQTWAFVLGKFTTDPIWWFLLFWIPDFLQRNHGLNLMQIGLPIAVIYILADVGSIGGGWLSSWMIHRGHSVNFARKLTMLVCALCVVPIVFAYRIESLWGAVLLIGLAAAAHQGFSANIFTLTSDIFPPQAVASVVGIGGTAGAVGGMLMAKIVGYVLQWTSSYMIPFLIAGFAYLVSLGIIQALAPRLDPAKI
jgi:MFS transporter, ACS family, hexuronate transporter